MRFSIAATDAVVQYTRPSVSTVLTKYSSHWTNWIQNYYSYREQYYKMKLHCEQNNLVVKGSWLTLTGFPRVAGVASLANSGGGTCCTLGNGTTISWKKKQWHFSLQWRNNERSGVSNHLPHDCLLNRLFRLRSKKTSEFASLAFVLGIHRWPVNSTHKWPVTRKMFPFDDVIVFKMNCDVWNFIWDVGSNLWVLYNAV